MQISALATEGFFVRLKVEYFYGCNWGGATIEEFADMLNTYLGWYRDVIKSDLSYMSLGGTVRV